MKMKNKFLLYAICFLILTSFANSTDVYISETDRFMVTSQKPNTICGVNTTCKDNINTPIGTNVSYNGLPSVCPCYDSSATLKNKSRYYATFENVSSGDSVLYRHLFSGVPSQIDYFKLFFYFNGNFSPSTTTWNNQPLDCNVDTGECSGGYSGTYGYSYNESAGGSDYYVYWNLSEYGYNQAFLTEGNPYNDLNILVFEGHENLDNGYTTWNSGYGELVIYGLGNYSTLRIYALVNFIPTSNILIEVCNEDSSSCYTKNTNSDGYVEFELPAYEYYTYGGTYYGINEIGAIYLNENEENAYLYFDYEDCIQTQNASYAGYVYKDGLPLQSSIVFIVSPNSSVYTTITNENGFYNISRIPNNIYLGAASAYINGVLKTIYRYNLFIYGNYIDSPYIFTSTESILNVTTEDENSNMLQDVLINIYDCPLTTYPTMRESYENGESCVILNQKYTDVNGEALFDYRNILLPDHFLVVSSLSSYEDGLYEVTDLNTVTQINLLMPSAINTEFYVTVKDLYNSSMIDNARITVIYNNNKIISGFTSIGQFNFTTVDMITSASINVTAVGYLPEYRNIPVLTGHIHNKLILMESESPMQNNTVNISGWVIDNETGNTIFTPIDVQCVLPSGTHMTWSIYTDRLTGYYSLNDTIPMYSSCFVNTRSFSYLDQTSINYYMNNNININFSLGISQNKVWNFQVRIRNSQTYAYISGIRMDFTYKGNQSHSKCKTSGTDWSDSNGYIWQYTMCSGEYLLKFSHNDYESMNETVFFDPQNVALALDIHPLSNMYWLKGRVYSSTSEGKTPLNNIEVVILSASKHRVTSVYTNNDGYYSVRLSVNGYYVYAENSNGIKSEEIPVNIIDGDRYVELVISEFTELWTRFIIGLLYFIIDLGWIARIIIFLLFLSAAVVLIYTILKPLGLI